MTHKHRRPHLKTDLMLKIQTKKFDDDQSQQSQETFKHAYFLAKNWE